jgi:ankyrin repeat protein
MLAAMQGHRGTVQVLIEAAADLNLQDNVGRTALMRASEDGHMAIVQALISAGADLNLLEKVSGGDNRTAAPCKQACSLQSSSLARSHCR